jgi:hypothetical protein
MPRARILDSHCAAIVDGRTSIALLSDGAPEGLSSDPLKIVIESARHLIAHGCRRGYNGRIAGGVSPGRPLIDHKKIRLRPKLTSAGDVPIIVEIEEAALLASSL